MISDDQELTGLLSQEFDIEMLEIDDISIMSVAGGVNYFVRACTSNACTGSCDSTGC